MGRLLEADTLDILRRDGIPVVDYARVGRVEEVSDVCTRLGLPVVVKAQVPVGGRGKGGFVQTAATYEAAREAAGDMLGKRFKNYPVNEVLISPNVEVAEEWFVSITFDYNLQAPTVLFSAEGGVDIEQTVRERPDTLIRREVHPLEGLRPFQAREICEEAGLKGRVLLKVAEVLTGMYQIYTRYDALLLEINPLVLTKSGDVVAVSGVLTPDERAMFRHPEMEGLDQVAGNGWRPFTPLEEAMQEVDRSDPTVGHIRFNDLEGGDVLMMVTGGGGGTIAFDTLTQLGLRPATTFDITNGQIEEKVYQATKLLLSRVKARGFIAASNFSNFSPVDIKVRGIVRAIRDLGLDGHQLPIVLRFCGPNQDEAERLARSIPGAVYLDERYTIEDALRIVGERVLGVASA